MTKSKIFIGVDNERIEATGEVLAQILADAEIYNQQKLEKETEAQAKEIAKAALLDRLGITEDEAKLLLA
jgi:hypothetical protein